jgi:hypothetical protein
MLWEFFSHGNLSLFLRILNHSLEGGAGGVGLESEGKSADWTIFEISGVVFSRYRSKQCQDLRCTIVKKKIDINISAKIRRS